MLELQELRRENAALRWQLEATRGFVHDPYTDLAAAPVRVEDLMTDDL